MLYFNTFHWIALRWIDLNVYLRKEFSRVIWRQGYNTLYWIALHWIDLIECLYQKKSSHRLFGGTIILECDYISIDYIG